MWYNTTFGFFCVCVTIQGGVDTRLLRKSWTSKAQLAIFVVYLSSVSLEALYI